MAKKVEDLPPEERIEKLKKLEKKREKELGEAREKLKETEQELAERKKWEERVRVPRLDEEEQPLARREETLEETVEREQPETPPPPPRHVEYGTPHHEMARQSDYLVQLSQRPMNELQREMMELYQGTAQKGYTTREEAQRVQYLLGAVEEKLQAVETGRYSPTEDVADAALLTKQLGEKVRETYKERRSNTMHDWYKGV